MYTTVAHEPGHDNHRAGILHTDFIEAPFTGPLETTRRHLPHSSMPDDSDPTVFSTDRSLRQVCPTCNRHPCACTPPGDVIPTETQLRIRLEKKGRGGKAVTVVFDLPTHPEFFARLTKALKAHCGSGGALKEGRMEFQGDQRDKVQAFLEQMGFTVRKAGG